MDLTDQDLQTIADELGVPRTDLQSEAVKDCAESVFRENPDMSKSQAFAVCQDMENEGQLAAPETHVALADLQAPGAITREEEADGTVRYGNVLLLAPGVWGDAGSGQRIYYSEDGIANSADNWADDTVNLFHEQDNETVEVGRVDTGSIFLGEDDGGLYGDIVLSMDNEASRLTDELLQQAMETNGREGLQGPSVELRGEEYRFNAAKGVHELVEGTFNGLGLVGLGVSPGPGSKDAAFSEQTRERAVALASTDATGVFTRTPQPMELQELRERLADEAVPIDDDVDADELRQLAAALDIDLQDDDTEGDDEGDPDEDGDEEDDAGEDEEGSDPEMTLEDVASEVADMREQVAENAERIDTIHQQFEELDEGADLSDLFETVSDVTETLETLADAEDVADLESRLSDLEDEPEAPTSLADIDEAEPTDEESSKWHDELGPNAPGKPRVQRGGF